MYHIVSYILAIYIVEFNRSYFVLNCKLCNNVGFKATLFSAPVSSELPFCKTILLRKLLISPILFFQSKSGKEDTVLHILGNQKILIAMFPLRLTLQILFNFFFHFRKVALLPKIVGGFSVFFRCVFGLVVDLRPRPQVSGSF